MDIGRMLDVSRSGWWGDLPRWRAAKCASACSILIDLYQHSDRVTELAKSGWLGRMLTHVVYITLHPINYVITRQLPLQQLQQVSIDESSQTRYTQQAIWFTPVTRQIA